MIRLCLPLVALLLSAGCGARLPAVAEQVTAPQSREASVEPERLLHCSLNQIQMDMGARRWRNANPAAVELLQNESREIWLVRSDKPHQRRLVRLDFVASGLRLCDGGGRDCASLPATDRDLQRGRQQAVGIRKVRAMLKCQYPPRFWRAQWQ